MIWVTPSINQALSYIAPADSHDDIKELSVEDFEKKWGVLANELSEFSEKDGKIISESDDGENGYLMVLNTKYAKGGAANPEKTTNMQKTDTSDIVSLLEYIATLKNTLSFLDSPDDTAAILEQISATETALEFLKDNLAEAIVFDELHCERPPSPEELYAKPNAHLFEILEAVSAVYAPAWEVIERLKDEAKKANPAQKAEINKEVSKIEWAVAVVQLLWGDRLTELILQKAKNKNLKLSDEDLSSIHEMLTDGRYMENDHSTTLQQYTDDLIEEFGVPEPPAPIETNIKTVRDLANIDAEQNGVLTGTFFSLLKVGDEFTVNRKKYKVTRLTKPKQKQIEQGPKAGKKYSQTNISIIQEDNANAKPITGTLWIWESGYGSWHGASSSRKSDPWGQLSREIEGDLSVDLINEKNPLHDFSDSYKILKAYIEKEAALQTPIESLATKSVKELDELIAQLESGMSDILKQKDTKRAEKLNELIASVIDIRNSKKKPAKETEEPIYKEDGTLNISQPFDQWNKSQLKKAGFDTAATGYGDYADVIKIGDKPAIAYRYGDSRPFPIMGLSVQKDFRKKGIAEQFLREQAEDGKILVQSPNANLMRVLERIGDVSEPNSEDIVTVTIDQKATGGELSVGALTNLGVVEEVYPSQYKINGTIFHKKFVTPLRLDDALKSIPEREPLYVDEHGKDIVWDNGEYFIAVDDVNDARYITLWNKKITPPARVGILSAGVSDGGHKQGKWLSIWNVEIDKKERGQGLAKFMYQMLLKYSSDEVSGIYSYLPKRVNKNQVPRIYRHFNAQTIGDYQFIEKSNNYGKYATGGAVENKADFAEWSELVNMSYEALKAFYESEDGKSAGLPESVAKEMGISSGRESARWIMRMKKTPYSKWTPTMHKWAKKQINFIKRMSGVSGPLVLPSGQKSRKLKSLMIWGHNPLLKATGGFSYLAKTK